MKIYFNDYVCAKDNYNTARERWWKVDVIIFGRYYSKDRQYSCKIEDAVSLKEVLIDTKYNNDLIANNANDDNHYKLAQDAVSELLNTIAPGRVFHSSML